MSMDLAIAWPPILTVPNLKYVDIKGFIETRCQRLTLNFL